MIEHSRISSDELHRLIRKGKVKFAGNRKLKIYGTLHCSSGKRMNRKNRVFFSDEGEALATGYRLCKKCMKRSE